MNWYDVNEHGQYVLNSVDGNFALREDVEPILNSLQQLKDEIAARYEKHFGIKRTTNWEESRTLFIAEMRRLTI